MSHGINRGSERTEKEYTNNMDGKEEKKIMAFYFARDPP